MFNNKHLKKVSDNSKARDRVIYTQNISKVFKHVSVPILF